MFMGIISWQAYIIIAATIFILYLIKDLIQDRDYLCFETVYSDIVESLLVGSAWIISVPIIILANIVLAIINIVLSLILGEEEEDE